MPASWLEQKLAQNGFTLKDLAAQTGLSLEAIEQLSKTERGSDPQWNLVLSTLNSYPALYAPGRDLCDLIGMRIQEEGRDALCTVYYGVNQSDLLFVACRFDDASLHGANVDVSLLKHFSIPLGDAYALFEAQRLAEENGLAYTD